MNAGDGAVRALDGGDHAGQIQSGRAVFQARVISDRCRRRDRDGPAAKIGLDKGVFSRKAFVPDGEGKSAVVGNNPTCGVIRSSSAICLIVSTAPRSTIIEVGAAFVSNELKCVSADETVFTFY